MRLVICELIDEGVLFLGQNTYKLENQYVFDSAFLSLMERFVGILFFFRSKLTLWLCSDPTDELLMIIGIFSHFFAVETTLAERQFFRALAKLIGRRAARLSSCGIAAIVSKMGYLDEGCHVGADGSLYNVCSLICGVLCRVAYLLSCRNTLGLLTGYMRDSSIFLARREGLYSFHVIFQVLASLVFLNNLKRNIITHHAEDGSGVGSAIIAGSCFEFIIYI